MSKDVVRTEAAPHRSRARRISRRSRRTALVFIWRPLALRTGEKEMMGGEIGAQTEQVFSNLLAILEEWASSLISSWKTTVFLQNLDDFAGMNEVYDEERRVTPPARSDGRGGQSASSRAGQIEAIATV